MKNRKSGFALVIALSLMAFVLLLLLSITTLVRVETSSAEMSEDQLKARMNAQLGALIALGDLQKLVGADQRVTARADVLVAPDDDVIEGQAQWTGVWSSRPYDEVGAGSVRDSAVGLDISEANDRRRPQWLVSGEEDDLADPLTGTIIDITGDDNAITLASNGKGVGDDRDEVVVLQMPIRGGNEAEVGKFAYWVSDEGVKARVNMINPHVDPSGAGSDELYYMFAAPQSPDASLLSTNGSYPFLGGGKSFWKDSTEDLHSSIGKLYDRNSLSNLTDPIGQSTVSREFFHDLSFSSKSVLANVKNGGLKQDLSVALLQPAANGLNDTIFPSVSGAGTVGNPGGPTWLQMADHYKMAVDSTKDAADLTSRDLDNAGTVTFKPYTDDTVAIQPVVSRFSLHYHAIGDRVEFLEHHPLNYEADGVTLKSKPDYLQWINPPLLANWEFIVGIFPMITLWNPYDHDMVFDEDIGVEMQMEGVTIVRSSTDATEVKTILPRSDLQTMSDPGVKAIWLTLKVKDLTIPAGRAINFSPPNNSYIDLDNGENNCLVPGAGYGFVTGFYTSNPVRMPDDSAKIADLGTDSGPALICEINKDHNKYPNMPIYAELVASIRNENNFDRCRVNFYPFPIKSKPDREDRFMSMLTTGPFFSHRNNDKSPRVLRGWDITGGLDADNDLKASNGTAYSKYRFIEAEGSSLQYPEYGSSPQMQTDGGLSAVDLELVELLERTINGIARYMNFPESEITGGSQLAQFVSQMNPRSPLLHLSPHQAMSKNNNNREALYELFTSEANSSWSYSLGQLQRNFTTGLDGDDGRWGYVGTDIESAKGSERMILFEVPTQAPLGIGQFMHANLLNVGAIGSNVPNGSWYSNQQPTMFYPSYAIGNSMASMMLPLYETGMHVDADSGYFSNLDAGGAGTRTNEGVHYDYSYLLNEALWDDFYMSTIIPTTYHGPLNFPSDGLLPNASLKLWRGDATEADLLDSGKSAAHLMLDGGFNVNSTSVSAWESILGALRDVDTLGELPSEEAQKHSFARFLSPLQESTKEIPTVSFQTREIIMAGFRSLTDAQISTLAEEIVEEIRIRRAERGYPFLSLAEFINRSIDPNDTERFAYMGVLQFALEQAGVNGPSAITKEWESDAGQTEGLNVDEFITSNIPDSVKPYHRSSVEATKSRSFLNGAAGSVTQADVLSKVGSMLVPRSDTFTIRSYGVHNDSVTNKKSSEAYMEMTVQRVPEYTDDRDEDYDLPTVDLNEKFGRKFIIVSTRWLSGDEI